MTSISKSDKTYIGIIAVMLMGKAVWTFNGLDDPLIQRSINSWASMLIISFVGFIAYRLSEKGDFPKAWDSAISNRKRFVIPSIYGALFGLIQIVFAYAQNIKVPMVAFPLSIPVYIGVGILSEILFHLIPVVFLYWIFAKMILKDRWKSQIFWVVAILVSLWEPTMQIIAMSKMGILASSLALVFPFVLVFSANIVPVIFFRKYGFLSAVVWRISNYFVWHIVFGGFFM